ncbi:unnamed protein product [Paramecium octaurelia]|uniref:BART domain-containing protein n=1 Tax=Paramecium octaurelia TaxID=43137 RepID=A0A8S1SXS2_PAROT|nr:unnamed protein product [Paramecium octaurelia]
MGSDNSKAKAQKKQNPPQNSAPKPPPKKKTQEENNWMYDLILQYLASPVWRNPISDFLDEHCIIFDDEEENKIVYQEIHKKFKNMIEAMMEQLMQDIGVDDEEYLRKVIEIGLKNKKHRKYFEQLLVVENFLVFKKLMLKRNKELEYEALKELQKIDGGKNLEMDLKVKQAELEKERMEIEHAVAMSIAVEQEKSKLQIQEEEELQEAIKMSQKLFEQQQSELLKSNMEQQKQLHQQPQASQQQQPIVPDQKVESILIFEDDGLPDKNPSNVVEQQQQQVEVKNEPKQQRVREPLPQIVQEKKEVLSLAQEREALMNQGNQLKENLKEIEETFKQNMKNQQDQETLEQRKLRLQQQRELIKQKKMKERKDEIEQYKAGSEQDKPAQDLHDKEKGPLVVDMNDFVADQKRAQELELKKQELRKRAELLRKIKQDAQQQEQN